jgi:Prolyl oligopeptidase family
VTQAGVFDMLRFHLFTDRWSWKPEYGDPDDPVQSGWLAAYSPLHNIPPGPYPATLLTTGDHDDRVVPSHTLKFGAALQAAQTASAPILIRVYSDSGARHASNQRDGDRASRQPGLLGSSPDDLTGNHTLPRRAERRAVQSSPARSCGRAGNRIHADRLRAACPRDPSFGAV